MDRRTLFYWARLYQGQLQKGQTYKKLCRTVTINVLDYQFLPEQEKYHSQYSLYEKSTHHQLNRDLEIHFLELPKWRAYPRKDKNRLDKWVNYLSNSNEEESEEIAMSEPVIRKALTAEEIFLKQDKERYLYEMREKALWDELSQLEGAREDGIQIGIKQGIQQGIEQRNVEIASRLLAKGYSPEDIADSTGLAVEEVYKLRN